MMKKIVTLVLVLSMVSIASAGLQISVNGDQNPADSQIEIYPSDMLVLGIWTDADIALFEGVPMWALVCTELGTIAGGVDQLPTNPGVSVLGLTQDNPTIIPPAGEEGIYGGAMAFAPISAGTVLIDLIDFHCVGVGDVVITLYPTIDNVGVGEALDSVIIHQIPEPATMALLGLGALLLRRKK